MKCGSSYLWFECNNDKQVFNYKATFKNEQLKFSIMKVQIFLIKDK